MNAMRSYLPAAILCTGCLFTLSGMRQESTPLVGPLALLPRELEGYRSVDMKVGDEEMKTAGASTYLFRVFGTDSVSRFSVYVGYYEQQMHGLTIHSPKNCLPANGWDFVQMGTATLQTEKGPVTVNRSVVVNREQRALVYYWYQGRGRVAANEYRVKWDLLRDAALRGRTEEALVRIVVPLESRRADVAELDRADATASTVARRLIPEIRRVLPSWERT